jgi:hypothetical protein
MTRPNALRRTPPRHTPRHIRIALLAGWLALAGSIWMLYSDRYALIGGFALWLSILWLLVWKIWEVAGRGER